MPIYDLGKVVGPQGERGIQGPPGEQGIQGPPGPTGAPGEPGVVDYGVVTQAVSAHNTDPASHNDIRLLIEGLTNRLNALANSDDTTLDQMAEVVAYIKDNRDLISQITTNKVNVADIVDNLTTNVANKPLSAAQGVALKALIDAIPAWAMAASKPSYTAEEVGARPNTWMPTASDVGARPNTWTPSASDVGALPLSGGDMTGKISLPQALGLDFYGSYGDSALAANAIRSNYSNQIILGALGAWESIVTYQGIRPATDTSGAINLGEASRLWKNIYLSGVLSDGTNSIAVANIANKNDIPNVPSWAMQASKPGYTADEVGARPNTWMPSANDVGALPLSGGTMTGKILIGQGNNQGIDLGDNGVIGRWRSDLGNWHTFLGLYQGACILAHSSVPCRIRGSETRPKYNDNDMALVSDIPSNKETWTFTLEDGTEVTKAVYIG